MSTRFSTNCMSLKTVQFNYGQVQTHVIMSQLFKNWIISVLDIKLIDLQGHPEFLLIEPDMKKM